MHKSWQKLIPAALRARLTGQQSLHRVITNTFWLFLDRAIYLVLSLVIGALVARYLGPTQWGTLGYAASFAALFLTFATLALDEIAVRAMVRQEASTEAIMGTTFALRVFAAPLTFLAMIALLWLLEDDPTTRLLVIIYGSSLLLQPFNIVELWFQARVESKYVVWSRNANLVITNLLKIGFIIIRLPALAFAWTATLWKMLNLAGSTFIYGRQAPPMDRWRIDWTLAGSFLRDAGPLVIAGVASAVYMKIDQVLLGTLVNDTAVGIYAAAVRISELWYFIPIAIATSLFPILVHTRSQDPAAYTQRTQAFFDIMAAIGLSIAIFVTLAARPLIDIFGDQYVGSVAILRVHIWSVIFVCIGTGRDRVLLAENQSTFVMIATVIGAVANVGLNLWLIPQYAGYGAAWATLISYGVAYYFSTLLTRRQWPLFRQLSRSLLFSLRLPAVIRTVRQVLS